MNRLILVIGFMCVIAACQNDEVVFEQSADERVAEAVANLKAQLIAPADGWLLRYKPESESGTFNVLLNFDEENNVRIRTDFGVNDGEFYDQTITYRIDNSLGLELILENYSFFSFLFEQNSASFLAEYEFDYINETPDGALVFRSKTDPSSPTTLVFEPASGNEENLLGKELSNNLTLMSDSIPPRFTSSYRLQYINQDIVIHLSFDNLTRTISFTYISPDGTANGQPLDFSTSYTIQGNEIILNEPFTRNYLGNEITIENLRFGALNEASLTACNQPLNTYQYAATAGTSAVILENTLFDPNGANVFEESDFFFSFNQNVFDENGSLFQQITDDVEGSLAMLLYFDESTAEPFYALGFFIENESGTVTRALREFTFTLSGNQFQVEFAPDFTVLQDTTATFNEANIDKYLNLFAEGEGTYIYKIEDNVYEFYNPCNDVSFAFVHN
ncbi:DUF4302 domain-containing protein [Catalinimonas niigatensis]|uniref:DUF4302 domain-containing protein n=1 Tax=Catalinimonas niigatensis TaxID=1397264 RepID=UPI00266571F6|nr:DUF4302 domain-containing protein [Catalinimonas niigatensis]WPP49546.1 DUF4302 domain-containing protein [Catalinimonas niigatensis]